MMALKQRKEIFRGLRNSLEMQQKFPASLSRCTWSQSCKKFLPHYEVVFAVLKAHSLLRPMQILTRARWKLQAQALSYTWVHLSQQILACACCSGRGNCWEQAANCSVFQQSNSKPAHPCPSLLRNCSPSVSPDILWNFVTWYNEAYGLLLWIFTLFKML